MTSYTDFSSCPNVVWQNDDRRHVSGHRRVKPNYRHGWWNMGFTAFPIKPPKTLVLKAGRRFRNCKEGGRGK